MDPFTLLYVLYILKIALQAIVYITWQADSSSRTITFFYAAALALASVPLFHVVAHICYKKLFSDLSFVFYAILSIIAAPVSYQPLQPVKQHDQRVIFFALITTTDILALLAFTLHIFFSWRARSNRKTATEEEITVAPRPEPRDFEPALNEALPRAPDQPSEDSRRHTHSQPINMGSIREETLEVDAGHLEHRADHPEPTIPQHHSHVGRRGHISAPQI